MDVAKLKFEVTCMPNGKGNVR